MVAQGQDNYRSIDDVVVFGRRPLKTIGMQRTKVDTLALQRDIALSLADILSNNTTMFVKSYGRATESTAEFRGTSASHTQVTWNGMKINSPMLGTVDFSMIPSFLVDDVTLYHGASSIAVTGGGLGGAVVLSTLTPVADGITARYVQGVGSFSTFDQMLDVKVGSGGFGSVTKLIYSTSKNNYVYTNYDKKTDIFENGVLVGSYHPKERNKSGYFNDLHLQQQFSLRLGERADIGVAVWYADSKRGLPFLSVDYKDDSDFVNEQRNHTLRGVVEAAKRWEKFRLSGKSGYAYTDLRYDYFTKRAETVLSDITHSRTYADTWFANVSGEWSPAGNLRISAVAEIYYNHVRSHDRSTYHIGDNYNRDRWDSSVTLSARWRPFPRLGVAGIFRFESSGNKTVPVIPSFFVEYTLWERIGLVAKASVARNYRFPSLDDLYFQPGGNADLGPERGFTYDGGLETSFSIGRFNVKADVSAFDSRISDWIQWTPDVRGFWRPSNVKRVHSYGIEAKAAVGYRPSDDWIVKLDGTFAWTPSINRGERVNSNDASYGKQLCYVPRISASLSPGVCWRGWTLTWNWNHYSERFTTTSNETEHITGRLKPYYMNDLSVERDFSFRRFGVKIKGFIKNIFNAEYVTVLSRPMPGINFEVMAEFRINLKFKNKKL